ncbi:MAG: PHP domain-containing protein [Bryobacteraceae bacterium]
MIDLHTHTTASDGSDSPEQLVRRAAGCGLRALAITDHDTLDGFDAARESAARESLDLICGIELSARVEDETDPRRRNAHLLAYFFDDPGPEFRHWLLGLRRKRRERNGFIAARLQAMGIDIRLEDAEALGQNVTARPHFASLLISRGHAANIREAFDVFLGETGSAYVEREDPPVREAIEHVRAAAGVTSLAHPIRLNQPYASREEQLISGWAAAGLDALEVWHTDQGEAEERRYSEIAARCGLLRTGGSDYHGDHTPGILPGRGNGRLCVPPAVLDDLRRLAAGRAKLGPPSGIEAEIGQRPDGILRG